MPGTVSNYNKQKEKVVKQEFDSLHCEVLMMEAREN